MADIPAGSSLMIRRSLLRLNVALAAVLLGLAQPADAVIDLPGPGSATFE